MGPFLPLAATLLLPCVAYAAPAEYFSAGAASPGQTVFSLPASLPGGDGPHERNPATLSNCGTVSDILNIDTVELSPAAPEPGRQLRITGTGRIAEQIDGGSMQVSVKLKMSIASINLANIRLDLCQYSGFAGLDCPIAAGNVTVNKTIDVPEQIPSGDYQARVVLTSDQGKQIACLTGSATF